MHCIAQMCCSQHVPSLWVPAMTRCSYCTGLVQKLLHLTVRSTAALLMYCSMHSTWLTHQASLLSGSCIFLLVLSCFEQNTHSNYVFMAKAGGKPQCSCCCTAVPALYFAAVSCTIYIQQLLLLVRQARPQHHSPSPLTLYSISTKSASGGMF